MARVIGIALIISLSGFIFAANACANVVAPVPTPPLLHTGAYVLLAPRSGTRLVAYAPNRHFQPGSLAKLMTLYLVFDMLKAGRIQLDDRVHIDKREWEAGGARMFLRVNSDVSVRKLIQGTIVDGGNDAAMALGQFIGGNESSFVRYMNQYARALGLHNTHYVNATGVPAPNMYTSAGDVATLAADLWQNFPAYRHFFSRRTLTFSGITQYNRNILLWRDQGVDGMLTGSSKHGYHLVAAAKRRGERLIAVVMDAPNAQVRANRAEELLHYGFRFFATRELFPGHYVVAHIPVWSGSANRVPVGPDAPLYVTAPRDAIKTLTARAEMPASLVAPVAKAARLGRLLIREGGDTLCRTSLHALKAVTAAGMIKTWRDAAAISFLRFLDHHMPRL